MKSDPNLDAVRQARTEISREFGNDPARLVAHYIEMQNRFKDSKLIYGPDDIAPKKTGTTKAEPK